MGIISSIGKKIQKNWKKIAQNYKIDIEINGIPALSTFKFNHSSNLEFKTFLTQEFLERGYLGSTSFYASIAHNDEIMKKYFEVFDEIFFQISKCINGEILINDILKYPVSHSGFKRLN